MEIWNLINMQLMLFLLMAVGVFLRRKEIIRSEHKEMLTDLIVYIFLPCNILSSFMIGADAQILRISFTVFLISIAIQVFCTLINTFCYRKIPRKQRMILQYGTLCSNAAFIGNPVAEELYGALGLVYASIYLLPQRVAMWSAGLSYFTDMPSKKAVFKKVVTHPCIVCVVIGLVLMVTQAPVPIFLTKTIKSLGGCTTAMAMLFVGIVLAEAGLKDMVSRYTLLYTVIRLAGIPFVVMMGCYLAKVDATAAGLCTILAAMPSGSTTVILASKYHGDEIFATRCMVLSTLVSMAAIPVWCVILNWVF